MSKAWTPSTSEVETYRVVSLATTHLKRSDNDALQQAPDDPENNRVRCFF